MESLDLDPYVVDTLMPDLVGHDRQPAAFLVYLFLWRRAAGADQTATAADAAEGWCAISLRELAEGTGLSKRAVQSAIRRLVRRKLISVRRASITAVGQYRVECPWAHRGA